MDAKQRLVFESLDWTMSSNMLYIGNLELSVKSLKEGQCLEFDLCLRKISSRSRLGCHVP